MHKIIHIFSFLFFHFFVFLLKKNYYFRLAPKLLYSLSRDNNWRLDDVAFSRRHLDDDDNGWGLNQSRTQFVSNVGLSGKKMKWWDSGRLGNKRDRYIHIVNDAMIRFVRKFHGFSRMMMLRSCKHSATVRLCEPKSIWLIKASNTSLIWMCSGITTHLQPLSSGRFGLRLGQEDLSLLMSSAPYKVPCIAFGMMMRSWFTLDLYRWWNSIRW